MSRDQCCVPGCPESGRSHQVLHGFPNPEKDPDRFREWVNAVNGDILGLNNQYIYKQRRVCHAHFDKKYCCRYNRISNIAVPTINMPSPIDIPKFTIVERRPLQGIHNVMLDCPSTSKDSIEEQVLPTITTSSSPASSLRGSPVDHGGVTLDMPSLISPISQTSSRQNAPEDPPADSFTVEPGPSNAPEQIITNPSNQEQEVELEEDILQILGEAPQPDLALGKNIHKDIASRWQNILLKGLPKETKETILKKYLIPANCHFLIAPILNPEAKAAVPDILAKRDNTLLQKQNQIGVALAALSQLSEMILRNESSKQAFLQPLSDACRILCDSHSIETKTRRSIIMSSINTNLRDTVSTADRDKYLFGEDFGEKLKVAKTVQKTGESLLKVNPAASSSKNISYRNAPKRNLNFRGPIQRKPPNRATESTRGRPPPPPPVRQSRATTYSRHPNPPTKTMSPTRRNYRR